MALPTFTTRQVALSDDLTSIISHLTGGVGKTEAWSFRVSTSNNFLITLADAAGASKFSIRDSSGTELFSVNSLGAMSLTGSLVLTSFTFPTSASPSQTTDGQAVWDSDDNVLTVGDGASRKTFGYLGSTAAANLGTAASGSSNEASRVDHVHALPSPAQSGMLALGGGALTAPTGITGTGRVMLCDYAASAYSASIARDTTDGLASQAFPTHGGLLLYSSATPSASGTLAALVSGSVSGLVLTLTGPSGGAGNFGLFTGYMNAETGTVPNTAAAIAPDRSPWMRVRMNPTSGGAANITTRQFGFFGSLSATANGAYLRRNTTGNLFFVTRQGGSETAQDMGAQTNAQRWYDIYTPDAGVTWYCYDHTAATLYTSTTNVPTAATDLIVGHYVIQAAASQTSALSRIAVSYVDE